MNAEHNTFKELALPFKKLFHKLKRASQIKRK